MPVVGISTSRKAKGARYIRVLEKVGAEPVILRPDPEADIPSILDGVDGLVLSGGEDIDPYYYEEPFLDATPDKERDAFEIPLIRAALNRDMPIFGVCRGMEALNVVMGGKLTRKIEGHRSAGLVKSVFHDVYIAPGSRLGAIFGGAPIMRVNSRHHQGFTQSQKARGLLASAYVLDGDLIEAVESLEHTWVFGVQWHPERESENHPKNLNLFHALAEAAEKFSMITA